MAIGKGKSKRDQSRVSSNSQKANVFATCMSEMEKCFNDGCPYSHLSQEQVNRGLGQGGSVKRDQSCGSNDADKVARGRGKGRGKGKVANKKDTGGKSAGAESDDVAASEVVIQQLLPKPRWRTANLKGTCSNKGMHVHLHI